jgi:lantibiotic biosynthesis protein
MTSRLARPDFFVLRTPLDSFDAWLDWSTGLAAPAAPADGLEAALAADSTRLRARLVAWVGRPEVREALFLASPGLEGSLDLWLRDPVSERGREVERTLVRYFTRMAGRATPFGLFAGCTLGAIDASTRLAVAPASEARRHTRLDMDYLVALSESLARDPALAPVMPVRPNSSLHRAGGRLCYVETRLDGLQRTHHLVQVEATAALGATLAGAAAGAGPSALAAALVDDEVTEEDAAAYVEELIASQVLVSDMACPVTGPEPIEALIALLAPHPEGKDVGDRLARVRDELLAIDASGLGVAPARYRALAETLGPLPAKVDLVPAPAGATLGGAVLEEIERGVHLLAHLARPRRTDALARFRAAFLARYEGRAVPLLEALDQETGVGDALQGAEEPSPILRGLEVSSPDDETAAWSARETLLLARLGEALAAGRDEIALTEADLERLASPTARPLPGALAALATVEAESAEALARGAFRVVMQSMSGPSGARLLGRFCHADPALAHAVSRHLRAEEALDPGAVFVEIAHLPAARVGNILLRPVLREWEVEYLGRSGAAPEHRLPIGDLTIAVTGERIELRSVGLGRRVIPRLTTAHNFAWSSLPVYRFLCLLQREGTAGDVAWDWGPLYAAPFLPRVTAGRLVLARARWRAGAEELAELGRARGATARWRAVQDWRARRGLPRRVGLAEIEGVLPVDLDNALCVESFVQTMKARAEGVLVELPDQLCAEGPAGRFVHELVVPFVGADATAPREAAAPAAVHVRRTFPPGSDWLYAKCYTSPGLADDILREVIAPVVDEALRSGAADGWFFIRYGDPDFHLRVRFHGDAARLHGDVAPALQRAVTPLLEDARAWRLAFDTYEREVERYGGDEGIERAELIFQADSQAVIEILELLEPGDAGADERWRLALAGIDTLLTDLGLDLHMRADVVTELRASFARELGADREVERVLGRTYAAERAALESLLAPGLEHPLAPGLAILAERSGRIRPVVAELRALEAAGRLSLPVRTLAASYVHMHANRLLRGSARRQELVLYDFLARLYAGLAARAGQSPAPHRRRGGSG